MAPRGATRRNAAQHGSVELPATISRKVRYDPAPPQSTAARRGVAWRVARTCCPLPQHSALHCNALYAAWAGARGMGQRTLLDLPPRADDGEAEVADL